MLNKFLHRYGVGPGKHGLVSINVLVINHCSEGDPNSWYQIVIEDASGNDPEIGEVRTFVHRVVVSAQEV